MAKIINEVVNMLNSIRDRRIERDGLYKIALQVPEKEYFSTYDTVSADAADEILKNYLSFYEDDGVPFNTNISHNKNAHIIEITSELHYMENDHSKTRYVPDVLNINRRE